MCASKSSAPDGLGVAGTEEGAELVDCKEWIPTVPEKKAAASRSGLRGHHSTWNAQLSAEGSYCVDGWKYDQYRGKY